jgi:hypothetical protein
LEEREAGKTKEVVFRQLNAVSGTKTPKNEKRGKGTSRKHQEERKKKILFLNEK